VCGGVGQTFLVGLEAAVFRLLTALCSYD